MLTCSPQEKIIVQFIKMTCSNVYIRLILNVVTWMIPSCVFCLVIVVHESLACPEQLNCLLSFSSHKLFGFPAFFCIWTLSNNDCIILRFIFPHWGQLRDSYATITECSNTYWCSRRKNNALRAGGNLKIRVHLTYFVFCETYKYSIFCSFWRAVLNEKKYLGKVRKMYTSSFCSKVFTFLVFKFYKFS